MGAPGRSRVQALHDGDQGAFEHPASLSSYGGRSQSACQTISLRFWAVCPGGTALDPWPSRSDRVKITRPLDAAASPPHDELGVAPSREQLHGRRLAAARDRKIETRVAKTKVADVDPVEPRGENRIDEAEAIVVGGGGQT